MSVWTGLVRTSLVRQLLPTSTVASRSPVPWLAVVIETPKDTPNGGALDFANRKGRVVVVVYSSRADPSGLGNPV